jgi:hypothetical protein
VSIIDRLRLNAHLDEAALVSLWTDVSLDGMPLAHPHLESCAACRHRFAELGAWLESVRLDAVAEADEQFPAERLAAQHAQIFRRLEAAERPARVIVFPSSTPPLTSRSSHASRWIAAAAAACFVVGVGVGQLMDLRHSLNPRHPVASTDARLTGSGPVTRAGAMPLQNATGHEEVFLSELDASISRAPAELRALDAFTPRAGERSR